MSRAAKNPHAHTKSPREAGLVPGGLYTSGPTIDPAKVVGGVVQLLWEKGKPDKKQHLFINS